MDAAPSAMSHDWGRPVLVSFVSRRCITPVYHAGVSRRCITPVYHAGVSRRCITPVYHAGVSRRCITPVYHAGVSRRCITPVYHAGVSRRCITPVYHPGVSPRCITPVYHPGVSPRCITPVYHPGVSPRCITPAELANPGYTRPAPHTTQPAGPLFSRAVIQGLGRSMRPDERMLSLYSAMVNRAMSANSQAATRAAPTAAGAYPPAPTATGCGRRY